MNVMIDDQPPAPGLDVPHYDIDPARSRVAFEIGYFGIGSVAGAFLRCAGTVQMDGDDLATLAVEARIDADSIDTGNRQRDRKLRAANLLDAKQYPHLVFRSTAPPRVDGDRFALPGELTVRGITKDVVLEGRFEGFETDGDRAHAAFTATATLDRTDYAVRWSSVLEAGGALIGDRVDVQLDIRALRRPA